MSITERRSSQRTLVPLKGRVEEAKLQSGSAGAERAHSGSCRPAEVGQGQHQGPGPGDTAGSAPWHAMERTERARETASHTRTRNPSPAGEAAREGLFVFF